MGGNAVVREGKKMAVHGYRLHKIDAFVGRTRGPWTSASPGTYAEALTAALQPLLERPWVGAGSYARDPRDPLEELQPSTPITVVESVERVGNRIEVVASTGRTGEHTSLLSLKGPVEMPDAWAPARRFSVVFFCPDTGSEAVMASSTVGRSFIGIGVLNLASHLASFSNPGAWVRWVPRAMPDPQRIAEVASQDSVTELRLVRHSYDRAGAPTKPKVTLTQSGVTPAKRGALVSILERWMRAASGETSLVKAQEVSALVELADESIDTVGFTDGSVSFSENDKIQTISPSKLDGILVYPVGHSPLNPTDLTDACRARASHLSEILGIPVEFN